MLLQNKVYGTIAFVLGARLLTKLGCSLNSGIVVMNYYQNEIREKRWKVG
jgi:hypothetical protein